MAAMRGLARGDVVRSTVTGRTYQVAVAHPVTLVLRDRHGITLRGPRRYFELADGPLEEHAQTR